MVAAASEDLELQERRHSARSTEVRTFVFWTLAAFISCYCMKHSEKARTFFMGIKKHALPCHNASAG